jgi:hypothetical protein
MQSRTGLVNKTLGQLSYANYLYGTMTLVWSAGTDHKEWQNYCLADVLSPEFAANHVKSACVAV